MINLPLLSGLNATNRAIFEQMLQPRISFYDKGEVIYLPNDQIAFVQKGVIKISRSDEDGKYSIIEIIEEGSLIPNIYSTFVDSGLYEIECAKTCSVCFIDYGNLVNINNTVILDNYIRCINEHSKKQGERIHVLSQRTIREKLLTYFQIIKGKATEKTFVIPISYTSLAEFLCVDRSAMMREIRNMSDHNLIRVRGKNIIMVDYNEGE